MLVRLIRPLGIPITNHKAGGVAIAGTLSGQINQNTAPSCSTSSSEVDLLNAVVQAKIAADPSAGEISVEINGPTGSWSVTVKAGPEGSNPGATC